jgi:membrane protease subunit HflK
VADELEPSSADARARRGAARTALNAFTVLLASAILAAWAYTGFYQLDPGEAAIILRFGALDRVERDPGLRWHLPPPLRSHVIMRVDQLEREEFGGVEERDGEQLEPMVLQEAAMQTRDNSIVHLGFVVQYKIGDPAGVVFRIADRRAILRDAAQAVMREVVGRTPIDDVISEGRAPIEAEALRMLRTVLDDYQSGIEVESVQLLAGQVPPPVLAAYHDVTAADQDRDRLVEEARGYENEVVPRARAEAAELQAQSEGYREATVAESKGEAARFVALLTEYQRAPEVTRKRLYLEAMEDVLPKVQKLVIEKGTATLLPYLAPPPAGAAPKEDGR